MKMPWKKTNTPDISLKPSQGPSSSKSKKSGWSLSPRVLGAVAGFHLALTACAGKPSAEVNHTHPDTVDDFRTDSDAGADTPADAGAGAPVEPAVSSSAPVTFDAGREVPVSPDPVTDAPADAGVPAEAEVSSSVPASSDAGGDAPVDSDPVTDAPADAGAGAPAEPPPSASTTSDAGTNAPESAETSHFSLYQGMAPEVGPPDILDKVISIERGQIGTATVSILDPSGTISGFRSEDMTFSVSDVPDGVTVFVSPNPAPSHVPWVHVNFSVSPDAPLGENIITVQGSENNVTESVIIPLRITEAD